MTVNISTLSLTSPVVGTTFTHPIMLLDYSTPQIVKASPTIAAGDAVLYRKASGAWSRIGSLTTAPALISGSTKTLLLTILDTEIPAGTQAVAVMISDQTSPAEWCDLMLAWEVKEDRTVGTSDFAGGAVASVTAGVTLANDAITAAAIAASAGAEIADAVWDEALSGHATAGTAGKALSDAGSAGDPWSASVRTLTQASVNNNTTSAGIISRRRGDTWTISITDLGAIGATTKVFVTLKEHPGSPGDAGQPDDESILQVMLDQAGGADGLLYANKAAPAAPVVATDAAIAVDNAVSGNITVTVAARVTALLPINNGLYYDVSIVTPGTPEIVATPGEGVFVIFGDVTMAIS